MNNGVSAGGAIIRVVRRRHVVKVHKDHDALVRQWVPVAQEYPWYREEACGPTGPKALLGPP